MSENKKHVKDQKFYSPTMQQNVVQPVGARDWIEFSRGIYLSTWSFIFSVYSASRRSFNCVSSIKVKGYLGEHAMKW